MLIPGKPRHEAQPGVVGVLRYLHWQSNCSPVKPAFRQRPGTFGTSPWTPTGHR